MDPAEYFKCVAGSSRRFPRETWRSGGNHDQPGTPRSREKCPEQEPEQKQSGQEAPEQEQPVQEQPEQEDEAEQEHPD